jgi:hypothetical protein
MLPNIFAEPIILIQGAIAGLVLGFLLQKSGLSQFNVIVGQFLFRNFTILKVLLTAIIVGIIGIYGLMSLDLPVKIFLKQMPFFGIVIGAVIFGLGMVVLGYCPGTCVAAAGQGSRDAWWGILGMLFGAFIYSEIYGLISGNILSAPMIKTKSLPKLFNVSPWVIILLLTIFAIVFFRLVGKKKRVPKPTPEPTKLGQEEE